MTFPDLASLVAVVLVGITLGVFLRRVDEHLQHLLEQQRETNRLLARPIAVDVDVQSGHDLPGVTAKAFRSWT